jgi:hypothetical protein
MAKSCTSSHPDAKLIAACVEYAKALRGASGAFEVDPTADCDFAQALDHEALSICAKAAGVAAACKPKTLDGLRAKAGMAKIGLQLDSPGDAPLFVQLMRSLCDDVVRFHRDSADRQLASS